MKKHSIRMVAMLLCPLVFGAAALADSDGYYCAGPGYLAYQFDGLSVPENGHVLRVVYLDGAGRISPPLEVPLESFPVHGMKCGHDAIEMLGSGRVYIIDMADRLDPVRSDRVTEAHDRVTLTPGEGFAQVNLGDWSSRGVTALDSSDANFVYELVIERVEDNQGGAIYHRTTTELVCKTAAGEIVDRMSIFEGVFEETID